VLRAPVRREVEHRALQVRPAAAKKRFFADLREMRAA
jgi:hypothetical protein